MTDLSSAQIQCHNLPRNSDLQFCPRFATTAAIDCALTSVSEITNQVAAGGNQDQDEEGENNSGPSTLSPRRQKQRTQVKDARDVQLRETESRKPLKPEKAVLHWPEAVLLPNITTTSSKMNPARIFVASLGNPPPYASTRHSAGHILLKAAQSQMMFPTFQRSKSFANGLTSLGSDIGRSEFTLWQSPSLMNISGVALLKAYKTFIQTAQMSVTDPLPGLVVLYDEMETTPAQLRLRRGATSAKGHNGLKSVQQSLQSAGLMDKLGDRFVKIGVGIGRPAGGSRSSEDVSQYVLGNLTGSERQALDAKVPELIKLLDTELARMSK